MLEWACAEEEADELYLQDVSLATGKPDHLLRVSQYHRLVVGLNQDARKVQEQGGTETDSKSF